MLFTNTIRIAINFVSKQFDSGTKKMTHKNVHTLDDGYFPSAPPLCQECVNPNCPSPNFFKKKERDTFFWHIADHRNGHRAHPTRKKLNFQTPCISSFFFSEREKRRKENKESNPVVKWVPRKTTFVVSSCEFVKTREKTFNVSNRRRFKRRNRAPYADTFEIND